MLLVDHEGIIEVAPDLARRLQQGVYCQMGGQAGNRLGRGEHAHLDVTRRAQFSSYPQPLAPLRLQFGLEVSPGTITDGEPGREEYDQHLQDLEDAGQTTDLPLTGGEDAYTQHGLEQEGESE